MPESLQAVARKLSSLAGELEELAEALGELDVAYLEASRLRSLVDGMQWIKKFSGAVDEEIRNYRASRGEFGIGEFRGPNSAPEDEGKQPAKKKR